MGIYVEILIRAPMEALWEKTQAPEQHQRWDLRFTEIEYLPRPDESQPQRFLYGTRIGFGIAVRGEGESAGTRDDAGQQSSSLKFWSDDPKSLIREGSGYWKYIPAPEGIRFLTWYDYRARFGWAGRLLDAIAFRPLLGWATAWSFDRLRLWLEGGLDPAVALRQTIIHALARLALAVIWLFQGLVPKLIYRHPDELRMVMDAGVSPDRAPAAVMAAGILEVLLGLAMVLAWRARSLFLANVLLMIVATIAVACYSPSYLVAAFNPVVLNLAVLVLAVLGYLASAEIPSAVRCRRTPPGRAAGAAGGPGTQ